MRKLIALFLLAAVGASAQVTNTVNISNSLLGPVTNVFNDTVVEVAGDIVLTGSVFNASVTNTISVTNNLTITNSFEIGNVSVSNEIVNNVTVTNIVENIAVSTTNTFSPTQNITITNLFSITSIFDIDNDGDILGIGTNGYRSIVPAESGVADLGRTNAQWRNGYFAEVLVDNVSIPPIPRVGTEQDIVVLQYDPGSTQYFWGGIGFPVPTFEGTNIYTYTNTYSTNIPATFIASSTQIAVHAWGAAGGGGASGSVGGAGGYVFAILSTIPGTVYEVIVGNGGSYANAANQVRVGGSPGGGDGYQGFATGTGAGGGYSGLLINDSTNFVVVAGAGSGGCGNNNPGRNGGGIIGQDGATAGSNVVAGIGARSDNFYGLNAVAGTNTTGFGNGGFLQGGHAQANAFGSNLSGVLGGGGAGWFGGSAGGITAATGNGQASGGGGISYANPAYVTFAYSVRSPTIGTAPVTDLPIYVAGRANGVNALAGQPGLVVIIE
jgi:hypothetical protein